MNDIYITLTGNVAAEPRQYSFDEGVKVTSLRVLTTHRYFDKKTGQWVDGEKVCFAVRCWRALGENVAASVRAGQPVVVSGKLRIREFGAEGDRRFMPEIEASAVGHDLRWGTGAFTKPERGGGGAVSKEMRDRLDEETRDWAMGPRAHRSQARSVARDEPNPFHTDDAAAERARPVNADDGLPPMPASNDGPASAPEPFDDAASMFNPATAHASGSGADTAGPLGWGDGTTRSLGSGGDTAGQLGSGGDTAGQLGSGGDTAGQLGSGADAARPLGPGTEAAFPLDSEGSPARKRGPRGGAVRAVGAEGDTARILGGDADGKGRAAGGKKAGRDGKQLTMAEKAAA
ncbi:single-stranded DNA-binding protein [Nonomuraea sp. NPDC050202]|uniref:single-stranded DNA-binding protein n=1 Tax=Nonomuraea sp. NPDC050202 TaxID=3155035 RepID=UPI0033ED70ED